MANNIFQKMVFSSELRKRNCSNRKHNAYFDCQIHNNLAKSE